MSWPRYSTAPNAARGALLDAWRAWRGDWADTNPPDPASAAEIAELLRRVDHEIKFSGRRSNVRERAQRLVLWWWGRFMWARGWQDGA